MTGSMEFSELFLDDVRVPVDHRVGPEHDGWRVAMVTFSFERGTALVGEMLEAMALTRRLARLVDEAPEPDASRLELAVVLAELEGLWALTRRNIALASASGSPGVGGSVFKLHYTDVRHRLGELAMRIIGRAALSLDDVDGRPTAEHVDSWMHSLVLGIAAGTSQIQANIIAERVLGLPKDRG
jgi:alkylation response protein AidB-like acyl-CoA dehydrogenase